MPNVQYRSMMSSSDAIIWAIEADPQLRSTVMAVWMLERAPHPDRMAANIDRMVAAIPRLRQVAVEGQPRPSWVEAGHIDIDHHHVTTTIPGGSLEDVLDLAQTWVREPFDRTRPLWRLGLVTGLAGGRAAVVIKVHHAIADGMGMVLMLGAFTDLEAEPAPQPPADNVVELPIAREVYSKTKRLRVKTASAARRALHEPIKSAALTARTLVSAAKLVWPSRTPLSPVMTERSTELYMATKRLPLTTVKQAGKEHGASVNDVFVSVVTDALARYHRSLGTRCDRLRIHMPVDVRNERTATLAGNQFVPARISLEVPHTHRAARIASVRTQLATLCAEPALHHVNTISAAIARLGRPVTRVVIGGMMKGVDVLASNVPGPPIPLFLAGAQIEEFYSFGPPAGAALNVTLFSYDGEITFGLTIDGRAIGDRALFDICLDKAIADVFSEQPTLSLVAG